MKLVGGGFVMNGATPSSFYGEGMGGRGGAEFLAGEKGDSN